MRAAIATVVRDFMDEVGDLLVAKAAVFLSLPPSHASHQRKYQSLKAGALSSLRDNLCRCVLLTEPSAASRKSLGAVMTAFHVDIDGQWDAMVARCRGACDERA